MFRAIATSLIVLILLGLGCQWELGGEESARGEERGPRLASDEQTPRVWRRTAAGWQTTEAWFPEEPVGPPRLNPLTLAWLMLLVSLFFLVAGNSTEQTPQSGPKA